MYSRFCFGLLWLCSRAVKNNCSSVKITWAYSTSWDRCRKKLLTQTHYLRLVLRSECEFLQLIAMYFFSTGIEILVLYYRCRYFLVFAFIYDQEFLRWCCTIQIKSYELISVRCLAIFFNTPFLTGQAKELNYVPGTKLMSWIMCFIFRLHSSYWTLSRCRRSEQSVLTTRISWR